MKLISNQEYHEMCFELKQLRQAKNSKWKELEQQNNMNFYSSYNRLEESYRERMKELWNRENIDD